MSGTSVEGVTRLEMAIPAIWILKPLLVTVLLVMNGWKIGFWLWLRKTCVLLICILNKLFFDNLSIYRGSNEVIAHRIRPRPPNLDKSNYCAMMCDTYFSSSQSCQIQNCPLAHSKVEQQIWAYLTKYSKVICVCFKIISGLKLLTGLEPDGDLHDLVNTKPKPVVATGPKSAATTIEPALSSKSVAPWAYITQQILVKKSTWNYKLWFIMKQNFQDKAATSHFCFQCDEFFSNQSDFDQHTGCSSVHKHLVWIDQKREWRFRTPMVPPPYSLCQK